MRGLVTSWGRGVTRLQEEGVAGVMDLIQSLDKLLTAAGALGDLLGHGAAEAQVLDDSGACQAFVIYDSFSVQQ